MKSHTFFFSRESPEEVFFIFTFLTFHDKCVTLARRNKEFIDHADKKQTEIYSFARTKKSA